MNIEAVSQKAILLFDGHGGAKGEREGGAWKDRMIYQEEMGLWADLRGTTL